MPVVAAVLGQALVSVAAAAETAPAGMAAGIMAAAALVAAWGSAVELP